MKVVSVLCSGTQSSSSLVGGGYLDRAWVLIIFWFLTLLVCIVAI